MSEALSDLRVLELSGEVATRYCGKLFSEHGARVVQAHAPEDRALAYGGASALAYGAWLDQGKHRVADAYDLDQEPALIIAGQTPADLPAALALQAHWGGRPLLLALTWFGTRGPCAHWKGSDGLIQAMTGIAYAFGPQDGAPTLPQGHAPQVVAGTTAFIAALAALLGRRAGHACQRIDASVLQAHMCLAENGGAAFALGAPASARRGINRFGPTYPQSIFAAADGWIGITALTPQQWEGLCELIGMPELARDPAYATTDQRMAAADALDRILAPGFLKHPAAWLLEEGQRRRVPLAPVPTMAQVLRTPHWRERESFVGLRSQTHDFEAPAMPFRLAHRRADDPPPSRVPASGQGPLAGVRVLDLSMGWSGPLAGRHFADLGAEVIKVEGCAHMDWWRGWNALELGDPPPHELKTNFNAVNRNKRGITLDLRGETGRKLLLQLAQQSDLLIENYAPGVLDRLGLSAAQLAAANPDLVTISMGAFGSRGPWAGFRAYGSTTEQASGFPWMNGEASWPPAMQHTAYGDPIAGIYAAAASLIALYGRSRAGAASIDLSQVECLFQLAADGLIAQSVTGQAPPRTGNQRVASLWRGCLRCQGEDTWIAVEIPDARGLAQALRQVGIEDPRCAAGERGALDAALAAWARARESFAASAQLQAAGIAAGPVSPGTALLNDPQLQAEGYWCWLERRHIGRHVVPRSPYALDGRPAPLTRPSPTLGEHTGEVLAQVLGLNAATIEALERDGVTGTVPV